MDTTTTSAPTTQDALALLRADHRRIEALFADYTRLEDGDASAADKSGFIARIGAQIRAHAQILDEIFYPALGLSGEDLARVRTHHDGVQVQLERLAARRPDGVGVEAQVQALEAAMREHAAFEERELFPRAARLDLAELGTRLALRRGELLGDQGPD